MADARPRALIATRLTCGGIDKHGNHCDHPMIIDETRRTVRCPNSRCNLFGREYEMPSVLLKLHKDD